MSEKDIHNLLALVESQSQQVMQVSQQEALQSLIDAGILKADGKYAEPFQEMLVAAER